MLVWRVLVPKKVLNFYSAKSKDGSSPFQSDPPRPASSAAACIQTQNCLWSPGKMYLSSWASFFLSIHSYSAISLCSLYQTKRRCQRCENMSVWFTATEFTFLEFPATEFTKTSLEHHNLFTVSRYSTDIIAEQQSSNEFFIIMGVPQHPTPFQNDTFNNRVGGGD